MVRLLRSLQLVPANDGRALQAAAASTADALVLDLSAAIPDTERGNARRQAGDAVSRLGGAGRTAWIQVGDATSLRIRDDVEAAVGPGVEGVCLPSAESARQVLYLEALLRDREAAGGMEDGAIKIIPWIDSALGLGVCLDIVQASRRVVAVAFDAEGYAADAGMVRSPEGTELLYARGALVQAARRAGVLPLDGPFSIPGDQAGLVEESEQVKALGFGGKFVIDAGQAEQVNLMFRPTPAQVEDARRVTEAYEAAKSRGEPAAAVDGRRVGAVAAERAREILELAAAVDEKERTAAGGG